MPRLSSSQHHHLHGLLLQQHNPRRAASFLPASSATPLQPARAYTPDDDCPSSPSRHRAAAIAASRPADVAAPRSAARATALRAWRHVRQHGRLCPLGRPPIMSEHRLLPQAPPRPLSCLERKSHPRPASRLIMSAVMGPSAGGQAKPRPPSGNRHTAGSINCLSGPRNSRSRPAMPLLLFLPCVCPCDVKES